MGLYGRPSNKFGKKEKNWDENLLWKIKSKREQIKQNKMELGKNLTNHDKPKQIKI